RVRRARTWQPATRGPAGLQPSQAPVRGPRHIDFARQLNPYAPIGLQVTDPVRPVASTGKQVELAVVCREPDLNAVRPPTSTAGCGQVQEQVARGAHEPV